MLVQPLVLAVGTGLVYTGGSRAAGLHNETVSKTTQRQATEVSEGKVHSVKFTLYETNLSSFEIQACASLDSINAFGLP